MSAVALQNAWLLDPEAPEPRRGGLLLREGRIERPLGPHEAPPADAATYDVAGLGVAPGLLDVHDHGSLVFAPAGEVAGRLEQMGRDRLAHGVTGYLPTTVAWPQAELMTRVTELAVAVDALRDTRVGAATLGLHLEGPWISPGAAGAQPAPGIRPYDTREGHAVLERGEGRIAMVTLAPEVEGADALLGELGRRSIRAAIGHSLADVDSIERAIDQGASHVTHLFNAMGRTPPPRPRRRRRRAHGAAAHL